MKHNKFKTLGFAITVAVLSTGVARTQDPLPSWNDGLGNSPGDEIDVQ